MLKPATKGARIVVAALTVLMPLNRAMAWGPHTEITRAALAVIPGRGQLAKRFGDDWDRIARDYCWSADWREAVRPDHYADDYLLFPSMSGHPSSPSVGWSCRQS